MKIKMVSIPVIDPIKAFKYYTTILGFQEFMYDPSAQLAIVVSADEPNGTAMILEPALMSEISKTYQEKLRAAKIPVITLGVEDINAEYIRLVNLDVPFLKNPSQQSWGIEAIFDDGQGNYIQLMEEEKDQNN